MVGLRYKLALTAAQEQSCVRWEGICRAVWNTGLDQYRHAWRSNKVRPRDAQVWPGFAVQCAELAAAKKQPGLDWLTDAPTHVLQQTLRDLDQAVRRHSPWRTHFRSQRRSAPSLRFPAGKAIVVEQLSGRWGRVKLPKLGVVKFRMSRPVAGEIRSATISRDQLGWHISILVDDGQAVAEPGSHHGPAVGIDRGVVHALALSDGTFLDPRTPFTSAREGKFEKGLRRRLARQQRGSARAAVTKARIAKVKAKQARRRKDYAAKAAYKLTSRYGLVVLEKLPTAQMTRSARGTVEVPGKNVKAKSGLNRSILDQGWHAIALAIESAARRSGTRVAYVPAAYTSQMCSECGHTARMNREKQAEFCCRGCGFEDNADTNAAINVLAAGLAASGRGGLPLGRPQKRQTLDAA